MFMYEYVHARAGDLSSHYTPHYKLSVAIHARNYIGNLRPAFNNVQLHAVSRGHFLRGFPFFLHLTAVIIEYDRIGS